jgi:Trk K+ transport system NAD-binding subunit
VVIGYGSLGQKIAEILTAVNEEVVVVHPVESPGVDIVGDIVDPGVLECLPLSETRVIVLALDTDSETVVAATLLRDSAPDIPIIAGASSAANVAPIRKAGADHVLSVSQVSGQLLAHHVLGETVSLQARIKLVKVGPGRLVGKNPVAERIRERTGCTIVAVEREERVHMDFPAQFRLSQDDALYICGTTNGVERYQEVFSASRL